MGKPFFCQMCNECKEYGQDGGTEVQAHIYDKPFGEVSIHTICAVCFAKTQGGITSYKDQLVTRDLTNTVPIKVNDDGNLSI